LHAFQGYNVYFWSESLRREFEISSFDARTDMFARLDDTPLPLRDSPLYMVFPKTVDLLSAISIDLFPDEELGMLQRIDMLIVCLYWLIYRRTHEIEVIPIMLDTPGQV
jgi:hypothetical protein